MLLDHPNGGKELHGFDLPEHLETSIWVAAVPQGGGEKNYAILELLLSAGVSPNKKNRFYKTILDYDSLDINYIDLLRSYGAKKSSELDNN